jgi:hypothetical protein
MIATAIHIMMPSTTALSLAVGIIAFAVSLALVQSAEIINKFTSHLKG